MNPTNGRIEEMPVELRRSGSQSAPYLSVFVIPKVGKRVASFAGYHWKIKSINAETQEIVLVQDGLTSHGAQIAAGMRLPEGSAPSLSIVMEASE